MSESDTPSIKQLLSQRTEQLLRCLIKTDFFGPVLPTMAAIVQQTRLPKNIIQDAMVALELDGLIQQNKGIYTRVYPANPRKKQRIAVLTHTNIFHNAYGVYQDFLVGLSQSLARNDLQLTIKHDLNTLESKMVLVDELLEGGVIALVLLGRAEQELRQDLVQRKIPTVICGNSSFDLTDIPSVCNDNYGGMRRMVRHVIEQGHTEIAYYTSDVPQHDGFYRRLLAYREAMQVANLSPHEEMVFAEPHSAASARWAADVFVSMTHRPTVIVCGSDRDAYELIAELHRSDVKVPHQVGITGFDNSLFHAISELGLTTMEIFGREMGQFAGQHLLRIIEKPQMPIRIMVPTQLIARASVIPVS